MIERENYTLRASYDGRRSLSGWLRMAWVGVRVAIQHFASKTFRRGRRRKRRFERPHRFPVNIPDHES